ncbi:hypothetical protein J5834_03170 [bacterium]|nr:hypothetical protein [bacterium]
MFIRSAWNISEQNRLLRFDSTGRKPGDGDIAVITRKCSWLTKINEKARITTPEIAKAMNIRKFLEVGESARLNLGPFEIAVRELSPDGMKFNVTVGGTAYFCTYIPEIIIPFPENTTLLLPADPRFFSEDELPQLAGFVSSSMPKNLVISGDFANKFAKLLPSSRRFEIKNDALQQNVF